MSKAEGRVYIVGAGCGDADLITVRGQNLIENSDVIVYDDLISPNLLTLAKDGAEIIYMGKRSGRHSASQEEINRVLIELAHQGKTVCRLKGGDPFVFGRGGEEILALRAEGIAFEEVPGISSAIAIPAGAGIPVFGVDSGYIDGMQVNATSDNHQMGQLIAGYLFDDLMGGEGTVITLTHRPHPGVVKRCEAFDELIAANDKLTLITEQHVPAEQPINDAQDIVQNLLLANPDKGSITAILCAWDEPAIGATQACQEAGRDEILVVGVDGNEQAVSLIQEGTNLKATVAQNFQGMVDIVVEQMGKLFAGETIETGEKYAEATLITADNAADFIK